MVRLAQVSAPSDTGLWFHLLTGLGLVTILGLVILCALAICLRDSPPESRPAIITALAALFRGWFRRGGPPGAV